MSPDRTALRHIPLTLALLMPVALHAAPLTLPVGMVELAQRQDDPARFALPIGAYDGKAVPRQQVQGSLDQRTYRLDGFNGNTLALMLSLTEQVQGAGYEVLFTCATSACGGFDFRFAIDVLPEPQMHVDLGDFQFAAATNKAGDAISLLVSRTADQAFVQIITVTAKGNTATELPKVAAVVQPEPAPPQPQQQHQPKPQPQADLAAPPPTDLANALQTAGSVALDDLVFASGKADLQDQDYASLQALATWLAANPTQRVTLVGHTDASGTLAGNVALSKQRAASVRDWLINRYKASPAQVDAQGAGYLSPRASNQTPEGRQKNRRVEVMLTSTPVKSP